MTSRGLLDTSVFIASESGRALWADGLPDEGYVCVVTVAELELGVLAARDTETRARRLATAESVTAMRPLTVDTQAASHWARMRMRLHEEGRRAGINDLWVAAIAAAHNLPVVTQDGDFEVLAALDLIEVISV